jgi:RNA-directed DNA polymerase
MLWIPACNMAGGENRADVCLVIHRKRIWRIIFMKKSQMTVTGKSVTGASSADDPWDSIDWKSIKAHVKRLQMRIAKAVREGRHHKAKALQWLLTHSYQAKLLATRRVTQNRGKHTPGVDGVVWKTSRQKMRAASALKRRGYHPQPLRRIYIPKKCGNSKRPLSIPTITDRAQQALYLMALEPIVETVADRNAYGFRPDRSCADAIDHCFNSLVRKSSAPWTLEGDIKSCFDTILHAWLLENTLMDKIMLKKWLEAGYMENGTLYPTHRGTPQGGLISPCLLVNVLAGLEAAVKAVTKPCDKVNVCVYADDFIITGANREVLENKVKPAVQAFLAKRGLLLSETKTRITPIDQGFNFLGFNIRKYKGKLLIKPSKASVQRFLNSIRELIRNSVGLTTNQLIRVLNLRIQGWCNYYRHVVAKKTFSKIDHCIVKALLRWVKRRHPEKGVRWRINKYFRRRDNRQWIFHARVPTKDGTVRMLDLIQAGLIPIVRHVKIRSEATPYDPVFKEYFKKRHAIRLAKVKAKGLPGQLDENGLRMARAV